MVSGNVSGIWTVDESPYVIVDDITISSSNSLTIEAGVIVFVGKDLSINASGPIYVNGTATSPVTIKSPSDTVYWNRIYIVNNNSTFKYCNISEAKTGIYLYAESVYSPTYSVELLNCNFSNCSEYCIYGHAYGTCYANVGVFRTGKPTIQTIISNSVFEKSNAGFHFYTAGYNTYYGASQGKVNSTITNCIFDSILNSAIYCENTTYSGSSNISLTNNNFIDCWRGYLANEPYDITTQNNIFSGCKIGVERTGTLSGTISNNCFYNSDSASFIGYPSAYGQVVMTNRNGDPCDIAANIYLDPVFTDTISYKLDESSPCIDAGSTKEAFYDLCIPEGKGTEINDMGAYGGRGSCGYPKLSISPASSTLSDVSGRDTVFVENTGTGSMNWISYVNTTDTSWLKIIEGTTGTDEGYVVYEYKQNTGYQRQGKLFIEAEAASPMIDSSVITQEERIPDLAISGITLDKAMVEKGGELKVNYTITNQGERATIATNLYFYISENNSFEINTDLLGDSVIVESIGISESIDTNYTITIPDTLQVGDYYIIPIVNRDSLELESVFSNNYGSSLVEVQNDWPDLLTSTQSLSINSIERGGSIEINSTILNQGLRASNQSSIQYYFSYNNSFEEESDLLLSSEVLLGILEDQEIIAANTVVIPDSIQPGQYYLISYLNKDTIDYELNYSNNIKANAFTITRPLAPTDLESFVVTEKQIYLTWVDNSIVETGYEIYRSNTSLAEDFFLLSTTYSDKTNFLDTNKVSDTSYYYKIRAISVADSSEFSNITDCETNSTGSGLIVHYPFDGDTSDISGNNNHATLYGPVFSTDKNDSTNTACLFDGVDDYLEIGNGVKPEFPFSVSSWIFCNSYNDASSAIFSTDGMKNGIYYRGITFFILPQGRLQALIGAGDIYYKTSTSIEPVISEKEWHHIAFVFHSFSNIELYVDGVSYDLETGGSNTHTMTHSSAIGYIGQVLSNYYFNGKVDEFRVYNRKLSQYDIEYLSGEIIELPDPPANLVAKELSSSQVKLSWLRNSRNTTEVEISRSIFNNGNYSILDTISFSYSEYIDSNLTNNTKYYYKIKALGPLGNSEYSNESHATTLHEGVPEADDVSHCYDGNTPTLEATGTDIKWYSNITLTSLLYEGDNYTCALSDPGEYYFYVTQIYQGNESYPNTVKLTIKERPDIEFAQDKNDILPGESVTIQVDGAEYFYWFSDGYLPNSVGKQIVVSPEENTNYYAVGINATTCEDTVMIPVYVQCLNCADGDIITSDSGRFNHGCENQNYANNSECSWIISPSGIEHVYLQFEPDSFDVKTGDYVRIYDGMTNTSTLLGEFNNDNFPYQVITSGNKMLVELNTNGTATGSGFRAKYWSSKEQQTEPGDGITNTLKDKVILYPNPTKGELIIKGLEDFKDVHIEIFDIAGQSVKSQIMESNKLDISSFSEGIYWVKIFNGEEVAVKKIIKKH